MGPFAAIDEKNMPVPLTIKQEKRMRLINIITSACGAVRQLGTVFKSLLSVLPGAQSLPLADESLV
jgi:hypothetical protein